MGLIIKNNVVYNGAESEPIIYSEKEREVGVWTDGKPLYQKTFYYSTLSPARGDWTLLETLSFSIDTLVKYNVMNQYTEGNKQLGGGGYWRISYFNSNNSLYYYTPELGSYIEDVYITIQYTKTTDTPGSGTWTPSGVKAVHYSENEQVVGTWTDGSIVYEKSYQFTLASASSYSIQTLDTIANINNMWIKEGYGIGTYNNVKYSSVIGLYNSNPTETDIAGYLSYDSNNELKFEYRCGSFMHGGTACLTIRYTKSTI